MKTKLFLATLALTQLAATALHAGTLNFDFSFTGNLGTVTGEIFGLEDNTNSQDPTDIQLFSLPNQFPLTTPFDLGTGGSYAANNVGFGFSVSDGQIIDGQWTYFQVVTDPVYNALDVAFDVPDADFVVEYNSDQTGLVEDAANSITFTQDNSSSAPEPATLLLGGLALGVMSGFRALSKRAS
jgi:hypothetical protein